jgi:hypothetical protein
MGFSYGDYSSAAERLFVEQDVMGSNPISHPKYRPFSGRFLFASLSFIY